MKRSKFLTSAAAAVVAAPLLSSFTKTEIGALPKILPRKLTAGGLVALTAPSGCIWIKEVMPKMEGILAELGLKTVTGKTCYEQSGYLAGDDDLRSSELMNFFEDKSVSAILTMRGGWGCSRILDKLDYDIIAKNPKIILGFSDITSLLNAIYLKTGMITYHGPCGYSSWGDFTKQHVTKVLVGGEPYTLKNAVDLDLSLTPKSFTPGKAQGALIGGNLTVIASMIGTRYEPDWNGKILFLEDIEEEPYSIDRMLWQLKQADVFEKISGVVLGAFTDCIPEEPEKSFTLEEVLDQHFLDAGFPVYGGAAIGHLAPKFTVPIGIKAEVDADKHSLRLLEQTVS